MKTKLTKKEKAKHSGVSTKTYYNYEQYKNDIGILVDNVQKTVKEEFLRVMIELDKNKKKKISYEMIHTLAEMNLSVKKRTKILNTIIEYKEDAKGLLCKEFDMDQKVSTTIPFSISEWFTDNCKPDQTKNDFIREVLIDYYNNNKDKAV